MPRLAAMWFDGEVLGSALTQGLELEQALKGWDNFLETLANKGNFPLCFKNSLLTHLRFEQRRAAEERERRWERMRRLESTAVREEGEIFEVEGRHFKVWEGLPYPCESSYAEVSEYLAEYGQRVPSWEEFEGWCRDGGAVAVN